MTSQAQTGTQRLQRLLALVPYVVSRNVVGLAETAAAFGVSERELVDDLNMLWCVELRAPDPYCPIDLSYEGGEIMVSEAESIGRPLRLGVDEASALLVALRMLTEITLPGSGEPGSEADGAQALGSAILGSEALGSEALGSEALGRTIAKLEAAAGAAGSASSQVQVQVDKGHAAGILAQVSDAVSRRRRIHLRYYVTGRDEATERDVDPMRLLVVDGRTYLEGWCRRAEGVRLFRLDRVHGLEVLDVPAEVPPEAKPVDVDQGLFRPSEADVRVELALRPAGHWVAEYYPCENVERHGEELRVTLRTPDTRWIRRLALRLGEDGQVIAPAELAVQVGQDAAAALAQYAT